MKEIKFPLLKENQIEVRIGQVTKSGYSLLLYKTSRTDAEILDSVVGMGNWQKRFYTLNGVGIGEQVRAIVVCEVGIYDDDKKEWVWKSDSGTESQVEQDKGICSDAFKRASGGSCWGIGRELYYTDFIFVKAQTIKKVNGKGYELNDDDKYKRYTVEKIEWQEKPLKLKTLIIKDDEGSVVYSKGAYNKSAYSEPKTTKAPQPSVAMFDNDDFRIIREYENNLPQTKKEQFSAWLFRKVGKTDIDKLTEEQAKVVANSIRGNN